MRNNNFKNIVSWIMYFIGFIGFTAFLAAIKNISTEAWLYAIGAAFGTLLFVGSGYLRQ